MSYYSNYNDYLRDNEVNYCAKCQHTGVDIEFMNELIDTELEDGELLTQEQVKKMTFDDKVKFCRTVLKEPVKCDCIENPQDESYGL